MKLGSKEPARVTVLTDDLGGGTGNHLLAMTRHWDRNRWEVEIVSRAPLTARENPVVPVRNILPQGRLTLYPFAHLQDLGRIRENIRKRTPHIVHAYFFWSILFGRILKREGIIKTLIENREDQGFGWGSHEYFWLRMTRKIPDRIICVSDAVRDVVLERERPEKERVIVIRNGVEAISEKAERVTETRKELGITEDHLVVGMVANFNRAVKGVSRFLDAVPRIVEAVPSARFLLLGRGKEENALREKAKVLGVEPFVLFAGFRSDIHRFYDIMDVSALTSLSEGLSISLLESMLCGIPVVATCVGGNPEVVVDGETGYLVPPGDTSSFTAQTVKLLLDKNLRKQMGDNGRRRVEREFLLRDVASRYLQIYEGYLS